MKLRELLDALDGCGLIVTDTDLLNEELREWGHKAGTETEIVLLSKTLTTKRGEDE